jgi:glucose-1-phosphate adenylyltransferase
MVLAGGVGERLYPLTKERAKPAVYFGGPYRIIDFTLSNCLNSGLRKIFIALQYKSLSLTRHLRFGWSVVADELGEFIEVLHPQKRVGEHWYQGTADAVYQNLYSILREGPRQLIVLSGDHVYKMDYSRMLRFHLERGAGATIAVIEVPSDEAHRFGILQLDAEDRLTGFLEKPRDLPGGTHFASMGIYIFDVNVVLPVLEEDARQPTSHDFGKDIIPALVSQVPVYDEANMDLCRVNPEFNLYDPEWPLRTHQVQAPPAKFVFADEGRRCGRALDSVISAGCIISGSTIRGSVLCPNVRVHSFCDVEESILMPGVRVGRHARIRRAIVDRDVFIPRGAQIGYNAEEDRRRHTISDGGVVVVTKDEEPFVGEIDHEALRHEAHFDAS